MQCILIDRPTLGFLPLARAIERCLLSDVYMSRSKFDQFVAILTWYRVQFEIHFVLRATDAFIMFKSKIKSDKLHANRMIASSLRKGKFAIYLLINKLFSTQNNSIIQILIVTNEYLIRNIFDR